MTNTEAPTASPARIWRIFANMLRRMPPPQAVELFENYLFGYRDVPTITIQLPDNSKSDVSAWCDRFDAECGVTDRQSCTTVHEWGNTTPIVWHGWRVEIWSDIDGLVPTSPATETAERP